MMPYGELGFVNSGINPDGTIKADAPPGQLYNLDEDISQAKNIYREHPEQVEKLTALMKKIVGKGTRAPVGESASSAKGDTEPMQPSKPKVSNPKAQPKNSVLHADRKVPPNILFILTDDLGYGDLKSYNAQSEINTPHLDRLAKESVRFTDAYAAFPVCSPSRAAILTGQYVQRFGPNAEHYGTSILPDQHPTVAPLLKQAGYSTACLGKWNVNNSERQTIGANQHGFDHWFGFHINIDSHKHVVDRTGEADFLLNNKPVQREGWADTLFADDAIRLIDESKPEQPFFIYASFQTPHTPLQDPDDPSAPIADGRSSPKSRAVYVKMVEQLDTDIGRILAKLDAKGVAKNTLVVFTSDNGGSLNALQGPLKGHKLQLDEGGIRIPQFIRWPDVIPAGSTSAMPTIHMDLTRTILAAAGITDTGKVGADGRDLLPALSGDAIAKAALEERPLFWRHRDPQSKTDAIVSACVRVGDWKFQRKGDPASGKTVETLYNLGDDIGETNNLSRAEPNKLASLKSLLIEWEKEVAPASAVLTPPAVKTQKPPASDQSEAPKLQSAIEWSGGSMLVDGSSISTIIGKPDEYDVQAHDLRYLAEGDMTLQVDFDTKTDPNAQGTVLEWFDSKSAGFFRVSILRLAQQEVIYPQRTALLVVHGSSELKGKNWYDAANRLLAVPLNETQMTGMKTLCLRRTGTVLEAWLDGELLVTRDYQQPFFKLSLSEAERPFRHENGSRLRIGGGNSAGAFISPIKRVEVCKGSWDDARLLATFGLEKLIAPTRAELGKRESGRRQPIAGRLLPDSWTEKQKLDHVSGRLPDLMRQLQKDPHFPQYHLATPFAGHDSKSFGFQGYHFTPTASIDWYGLTGRRDLLWLHFFSPDLKAWSIRPIPYGSNIGANGNTIAWNGGVFTLIGKSPATGGNVLEGRASDLADWTESHRPIFVDKNPHGDVDRDPYLFIHEGKPWMVTAEHKSEKFPRFFLYSGNDDLSHWRYEGVLFQGDYPDPAHFECPSFFRIGQKFVFMHGAPYKVAENGHLVHIGRFEDKKFIKETSMPAIIPGWNGVHSVIEEPSKDRVLWFGYGKPLDTISGVQRGWSRTYPIVELRFDEPSNQIHVFPLREYEEMKTQRIMQHSGEVQPGRPVKLEHSFGSSFILDADLSLADGAKLTITLRNGQGEALTMTLTSEQMKLGAEATVAASKGETHSIKFCSDRSIFELYDNAGHALIHQFFPQDTEWRSIELSANGAAVSVSKLTADKVRSVWKNES